MRNRVVEVGKAGKRNEQDDLVQQFVYIITVNLCDELLPIT